MASALLFADPLGGRFEIGWRKKVQRNALFT